MRFFGVHLYALVPVLTLAVTLSRPQLCTAQDCEALRSVSAEDGVRSLDHGEIKTARCTWAAFQLIEHLPQKRAISVLIEHLGHKRPFTTELLGPRPYPLYPAVESLYNIGLAAEPALIEFIAQHEDERSIEHANALKALALIRHFDVVPTIRLIRERSLLLADTTAAHRLDSAAEYMLKTHCPSKLRKRCEERLRQSDSEK